MAILNPYLNFEGNARDAMEFYQDVFGGELNIMTFGDMGSEGGEHGAPVDGVMHAQLTTDLGFTLMGADTPPGMGDVAPNGQISLSGDEGDVLRGYFDRLSDGGQVVMPVEKQVWGDEFGMCADRFGVSWLVNIAGSPG